MTHANDPWHREFQRKAIILIPCDLAFPGMSLENRIKKQREEEVT
jgi:hypothetical protein